MLGCQLGQAVVFPSGPGLRIVGNLAGIASEGSIISLFLLRIAEAELRLHDFADQVLPLLPVFAGPGLSHALQGRCRRILHGFGSCLRGFQAEQSIMIGNAGRAIDAQPMLVAIELVHLVHRSGSPGRNGKADEVRCSDGESLSILVDRATRCQPSRGHATP